MDHTKSLKREHRLHNIVIPEFRYIRAARVVSRGRDFNTLPNPFVSVAQNVCCLSLLREKWYAYRNWIGVELLL